MTIGRGESCDAPGRTDVIRDKVGDAADFISPWSQKEAAELHELGLTTRKEAYRTCCTPRRY
jgi:hypothetical protein